MTNEEKEEQEKQKFILERTLEVENLIAGMFRADNGEIWRFSKIEPEERIGDLLISYPTTPPTGRAIKYEIIWVNDETIFLDLIMTSIPKPPEQHKIWITKDYLKILFSEENQPPNQSYLLLYRG